VHDGRRNGSVVIKKDHRFTTSVTATTLHVLRSQNAWQLEHLLQVIVLCLLLFTF